MTLNVVPEETLIKEPTGNETGTAEDTETDSTADIVTPLSSEVIFPLLSDSFVNGSAMSGSTTCSEVRSSIVNKKWRETLPLIISYFLRSLI